MTFATIVGIIVNLLGMVVKVLMALAVVTFLYGLMRYVMDSGDDSKRSESQQYMLYGIIGLFVMVSMWGLVSLLTSTFIPGGGVAIPVINI